MLIKWLFVMQNKEFYFGWGNITVQLTSSIWYSQALQICFACLNPNKVSCSEIITLVNKVSFNWNKILSKI